MNYAKHGNTIKQYRYQYRKSQWKIRQGLKHLSFHNTRFFGYSLKDLNRKDPGVLDQAVEGGWIQTRMKNRALLWKDPLRGRLLWFETGRITGHCKKPANKGKIMQLLANAFFKSDLIPDINLFHLWADSFRLKGSHLVYDTGETLPYARIELLKDSNGVIAVLGDKSHPTSIEIQFCYPDWAEKNEIILNQNIKAFQQFSGFMKDLISGPKPFGDEPRMIS